MVQYKQGTFKQYGTIINKEHLNNMVQYKQGTFKQYGTI